MSRGALLIVNPSAGGGRADSLVPEVESALRAAGIESRTERTRNIEHARELAQIARDGSMLAITLGGDGLVGCVAGVLAESDAVLGVLPGGRGNDFARVLGIPKDIGPACDVVLEGRERLIDIGDAAGRPFIGIASCGFDSEANRIANETRLLKGDLVYAYGALRALASWKPARFEIELDEREVLSFSGYSVAAANSKAYGGGMFIAPGAELDDGLLDVVMTGRATRRRFVMDLPKVFEGRHVDSPAVKIVRARSVRVSADRPFTMFADGDPIGDLPMTVRARHHALRVMAPA